jgi:tRNA1Val (adenine37-N6)-methyltransferase
LGLNFRELIENIGQLLAAEGFFSVVIPYESAQKFTGIAIENGFCCTRHTRVKPNPEKDFNRSLLGFSRIQGECEIRELTVSTMIRHQYTEEYKALTRDFYLWFLDEKA